MRDLTNKQSASTKPQPPPPPIPSLHPNTFSGRPSSSTSSCSASRFTNSLPALIDHNIHSLHKIRRAHTKLSNLQKDPDPDASPSKPYLGLNDSSERGEGKRDPMEEDEEETEAGGLLKREADRLEREASRRIHVGGGGRVLRRPEISSREALEGMKLLTGTMLAHVGFECKFDFFFFFLWERVLEQNHRWLSAHSFFLFLDQGGNQAAVDSLAHFVSEYLSNLGRTMRYYLDTQAHTMSPEVGDFVFFLSIERIDTDQPLLKRKSFCTRFSRTERPKLSSLSDTFGKTLNATVRRSRTWPKRCSMCMTKR